MSLDKTKHLSELALYGIGNQIWEADSPLSLEDYLRLEFLFNALSAGKPVDEIKDLYIKDICISLYIILKFSANFDKQTGDTKDELWNKMIFKTMGWNLVHLSKRAHQSRQDIWMRRYVSWLEIRIVGEEHESNRGVRYSSYTKGYHDGKSLRPEQPSDVQILDRDGYQNRVSTLLSILDFWDPDEWRRNL